VESYTLYLDYFKEFVSKEMRVELDYDSLSGVSLDKMQIMIEDYIMNLKNRVSPNSIPTFYYPIQSFCEANEIDLRWKKIRKLFPAKIKTSGELPYTTDDIQKMLSVTPQLRNKAIIHFLASTGCRVGALPDLKIKNLADIQNCKSVVIYEDSIEEYLVFLTPEASKALEEYFEKRRQDGEIITPDSPVFRSKYVLGSQPVTEISYKGLTNVVVRSSDKANLRDSKNKKHGRFSKQTDHAFRKRFNTILKLNTSINSNIVEKLLGHKRGLDGVYLKPTIDEMFEEFQKAIPQLTIDDSERKQALLDVALKEKSELEEKNEELEMQKDEMERLRHRIEALESRS